MENFELSPYLRNYLEVTIENVQKECFGEANGAGSMVFSDGNSAIIVTSHGHDPEHANMDANILVCAYKCLMENKQFREDLIKLLEKYLQ